MVIVENIQNGIREMVEGSYNIVPDTIKISQNDLNKVKEELIEANNICEPKTILGLKIVEDNSLNKNECILYNSKCYIEIKNLFVKSEKGDDK